MSTVDETRPPYVSWEYRPVEDRNASIAAGHYVSKDVAFATITRPGSRDTLDKEALVWLAEIREKGRKKEIPATWFPAFEASFKSWQTGEEAPVTGTPIKGWPILSPAAQKDLISSGIRTVEDLASMADGELGVIGTGAVSYKAKAKAWLTAAEGSGKTSEQIATLTQQVSDLTALTTKLIEENKALRADLPSKNPLKV